MATLRVPTDHPTLQDALNAAAPQDTIVVEAPRTETGTATVSDQGLTVQAAGGVTGIRLFFDAGVSTITLAGDAAIDVFGNARDSRIITTGGGTLYDLDGNDTLGSMFDPDTTLVGGRGNDVYYVSHQSDGVIEAVGEGVDGVITRAGGSTRSGSMSRTCRPCTAPSAPRISCSPATN